MSRPILLNGTQFVLNMGIEDDGGDDTGTTVPNSFESLAVTGGVFKVYTKNTVLSTVVMADLQLIAWYSCNIDNVDIGYNTPYR